MTRFEKVNSYVKVKNVHLDKKSKEENPNVIKPKPKYKLTGQPISELDQFVFFILAGHHPDSYHRITRIKITQSEWIDRNPKLPNKLNGDSYIDVTNYEVLTTNEVANKIVDGQNGFKYVARLPQTKFQMLQKKFEKIKYLRSPSSRETKRFIANALQVTPTIMKKLGI